MLSSILGKRLTIVMKTLVACVAFAMVTAAARAEAPLLSMMRGADGKPMVCDNVWISYLTGADDKNFVLDGKLTAGYGSMWGQDPSKPGDKIGPEFTFGLTMEAAIHEPILIIKTAWGGKSLHTDFRPPSAGAYQLSSFQQEHYAKQQGHGIPQDFEQWKVEKAKATGVSYRLMMEHIKKVLADPKHVVPTYAPDQGYELAGFVWLQGFNDMVDGHVYPKHGQPDRFDLYSVLLADFIRDVRKDLDAPKMPFVVGVMGVGGLEDQSADMVTFRRAMAAPAAMPEFKGNVAAEVAMWNRGASNAGYHYLGCGKTFALMGQAFARALLQMSGR